MSDSSSLRRRAHARLDAQPEEREGAGQGVRELLQELQLQQLDLELQNDELQRSRQRLEESSAALAASEGRYRELFESAAVGNLRLDANGAIVEANRTAAEIFGAEPSELAGRKLSHFLVARDQDAYHLHRHAAAQGASPAPARLTVHALDGHDREIELGARALGGEPGTLSVSILDVSARELAQAGHDESERQRRLMADALPVAVSYVGADGRYEFCNRAFERLYGRSASEIEGRPIFEVLDADTYATLREHVRAALSGETARFEGRLYFPALGTRVVSALLAPDRAPDGSVRGFCALIDDRTELDEARRSLRNAAAQAALAEERERRALAVDLHDDVGQLVSLLSIRLRELLDQVTQPEWAARLRDADDLARRIRRKISSLSFELSPPLLYDVGFLAAAEWLADSLEGQYGLKTSIARRGDLPALDEPTRVTLFRALRELLINVAKHAGIHRARVIVTGSAHEVSVAVEDDGCGFDPGASAGGFGLGSIRDRIESLGGKVSIDSAPARGATVSLRVPVTREAAP